MNSKEALEKEIAYLEKRKQAAYRNEYYSIYQELEERINNLKQVLQDLDKLKKLEKGIEKIKNLPNCDICDTKLTLRKDDNEEVARARFVTYERETAPLYDYFKQMGILKEIKADAPIAEVWENLKEIVFDE